MRAYQVNEYISNLEDIEIGEIASETDFEEQVEASEEEQFHRLHIEKIYGKIRFGFH